MPTLPYGDITMPRTTAYRQRGLTLIEAATVTGIVAVLVGITLPSFHELAQRRQVEGVAAQLETDLHLARSEAVARNQSVRVTMVNGEQGSCYVLHTGPAGGCICDGAGNVACAPAATPMRSVHLGAEAGVRLQSNVGALLFDATKGTVSPTGTLRVQGGAGHLHLVVNIMGRARACTPDGRIAGYRAC
jgi:type IV fimbrial biogenesis protein FimT